MANQYDAIIIGGAITGLKPIAKFMETISAGSMRRLRTDRRIGFSRFPRIEAETE